MTYRVVLIESEEGFAVFCPALPGCVSQGTTETEALDNIREAATLWLEAGGTAMPDGGLAREAELRQEASANSLTMRAGEIGLAVAA